MTGNAEGKNERARTIGEVYVRGLIDIRRSSQPVYWADSGWRNGFLVISSNAR